MEIDAVEGKQKEKQIEKRKEDEKDEELEGDLNERRENKRVKYNHDDDDEGIVFNLQFFFSNLNF